jgi:hypothetical protein
MCEATRASAARSGGSRERTSARCEWGRASRTSPHSGKGALRAERLGPRLAVFRRAEPREKIDDERRDPTFEPPGEVERVRVISQKASWRVGVLGASCLVLGMAATRPAEGLVGGDALPVVHGKSLSGSPVLLPEQAIGHPAMLVVGFSRASKEAAQPWLLNCREHFAAAAGEGARCYDVRMVEGIPRLFRGFVEGGMRKGYPAALLDQTVLVYRENDLWKQRLGVADETTAYVVVLDASGRVCGLQKGAFSESALSATLAGLSPPK